MIRSFSESKWASSKSYLYGKSLRNAPRATKIHFFIRYNHHDPLWWTGSLSPVLQIAGPSSLRPALCALAQLFPPQLPSKPICNEFSESYEGNIAKLAVIQELKTISGIAARCSLLQQSLFQRQLPS